MVDEVNAHILGELDQTTLKTYHSVDEVDASTPDDKALWPVDFLNSLTPNGMPPHALTLAPGALVMLLRNLDADAGLCNGVRAIIIHAMQGLGRVVGIRIKGRFSCLHSTIGASS